MVRKLGWRSIKVKDETKEKIDKGAEKERVPKSTLIDEAVDEFLDEDNSQEEEREFMDLF